jgi:secretion/DNA translocation related TadE-like protein
MTRFRSEQGQSGILAVVFLTVLLGMAALVVDVGSWYYAQRSAQSAADAAALAGAQALPQDTLLASDWASDYAGRNGGGLVDTTFDAHFVDDDTIRVEIEREAPGFFSKLFGVSTVTADARASARASAMSQAQFAAPIGVDLQHPLLSSIGCPCFGAETTLELNKVGPGGFRLMNIDGSRGGTGPGVLADWMLRGLDATMDVEQWYYSDSGARFNSSDMQGALDDRIGTELLFPIYSEIRGTGTNLEYYVVGWVGFHLTGYEARGNSGTITGHFTEVVWDGITTERAGQASFGVRAVNLVE